MEDRGCPVGPTEWGLREKYRCPAKYGVWSRGPAGVIFLDWTPIFRALLELL